MLNCVYHPVDKMRVVNDEERQKLLDTGVWFDSPFEAEMLKKDVEEDLKPKRKPKKLEKQDG